MFKKIRRFILLPFFIISFPMVAFICLLYAEDMEEFKENLAIFYEVP